MDKKSKTGRGGVVVNIGASASFRYQISTPIYTATKHAILGLTKSCGVIIRKFEGTMVSIKLANSWSYNSRTIITSILRVFELSQYAQV